MIVESFRLYLFRSLRASSSLRFQVCKSYEVVECESIAEYVVGMQVQGCGSINRKLLDGGGCHSCQERQPGLL